jgi:8-oxo-dGTP pyrophosphatase MutT (NUDIX family)
MPDSIIFAKQLRLFKGLIILLRLGLFASSFMYIGAGIIIHNLNKEVLLVCDARSGRWGFPKGHPEHCDKKLAINTAVRECFEETGMRVVNDYIIESMNPKRIGKRLYFNALLLNEAFLTHHLNKEEIQDVRWWKLEEMVTNEAILNSDLRCWLAKRKRARNTISSVVAATT